MDVCCPKGSLSNKHVWSSHPQNKWTLNSLCWTALALFVWSGIVAEYYSPRSAHRILWPPFQTPAQETWMGAADVWVNLVLFVRTGPCCGTMALWSALMMTNEDVCCVIVRWQIHHARPERTPLTLRVIGQHSFSGRDALKVTLDQWCFCWTNH